MFFLTYSMLEKELLYNTAENKMEPKLGNLLLQITTDRTSLESK